MPAPTRVRLKWLREAREAQMTRKQIAAELGCCEDTAGKLAMSIGLPSLSRGPRIKRWSINEAQIEDLKAMWNARVRLNDISAVLGVSRGQIKKYAVALGLPRRKQSHSSTWVSLSAFNEERLAERLAYSAKIESASLWNAEMVDDFRRMKKAS